MSYMEYKGYLGSVEYSAEDHCLYGKLAFIRDLVNYEADTVAELEQAFQEAVDHYLMSCENLGKTPNVPLRGVFNVRTSTDIHRDIILAASQEDMSLNAFVNQAIMEKLARHHATH